VGADTRDLDFSALVDPLLAEFRNRHGEATVLAVPANGVMVYLSFFPSLYAVAVREHLGTVRPMHCSALGKVYLAALDTEALELELGRLSFKGGTARAATGPTDLKRRLKQIRQVGYAVDEEETFEGVTCIATGARIGQRVVGAIGVSGPTERLKPHETDYGKRLIAISAAIND
jgi:DNA-binding IclR family transcriptional regulator